MVPVIWQDRNVPPDTFEPESIGGIAYMHDEPIKNNWDLYTALREARNTLDTVICQSNKYKYIRETQRKANNTVFDNLERLIMEYVK